MAWYSNVILHLMFFIRCFLRRIHLDTLSSNSLVLTMEKFHRMNVPKCKYSFSAHGHLRYFQFLSRTSKAAANTLICVSCTCVRVSPGSTPARWLWVHKVCTSNCIKFCQIALQRSGRTSQWALSEYLLAWLEASRPSRHCQFQAGQIVTGRWQSYLHQ